MRVSFSVFGREVFCFHVDRSDDLEVLEFDDWLEGEEEYEDEEYEDEEEEDEEEEVCLRWGEPAEFVRNIFAH